MPQCKPSEGGPPRYKLLPAGDTALVVELGESIDRKLSAWVLALARRLDAARMHGIIETVPTFRSLLVHYDPLVLSAASLGAHVEQMMRGLSIADQPGRSWSLPVCYDASIAPDLGGVAQRTGLSPAQVIERHSGVTYHVYMLGFLPGQAYMGDVPGDLALPRRATPRTQIPAGSLAIAATMTCIFPLATPCGWHLIGRSPVALWQRTPHPRAMLAPGDTVTFAPVSLREYESLLAQAVAGELRIASEGRTEVAA
ncbi:MAG TPA: 5-oxoprolinase subunit PxpB [Xanthobacteraceae bacterium]|jgi:KipI family sensor histidine kinase inhibitor